MTALAILVLGITVVSNIAVNLSSQRLLSKCIEVLDAVMYGESAGGEGTE